MEYPQLQCLCGKTFEQRNAMSNHTRCCPTSKKRMKEALESAQKLWKQKQEERASKRLKRDCPNAPETTISNRSTVFEEDVDDTTRGGSTSTESEQISSPPVEALIQNQDPNLSIAERRPRRSAKLPKRYRDILPTPLSPLDPSKSQNAEQSEATSSPLKRTPVNNQTTITPKNLQPLRSSKNAFGLFRHYSLRPSHDPEGVLDPSDLYDVPQAPTLGLLSRQDGAEGASSVESSTESLPMTAKKDYGPYPNKSSFLLGEWFWGSKSKSLSDFKALVKIMEKEDFRLDEIRGTAWDSINTLLGSASQSGSSEDSTWEALLANDSAWIKEEVWISVPFVKSKTSPDAQEYLVGEFYRRSIVSVLKERLSDEESRFFHMDPYELYWQLDDRGPVQRVYGELYTSRTFLEEHNRLQNLSPEPGCELPRVVAGLILAIDETHLTQFGNTKLHPLYMYFGNNSKYLRSKPAKNLCNYIAYFIKLPNDFREYYRAQNGGKSPGQNVVPHCLRETIHAQWRSVLDDEFVEAYEHGIVVTCKFDGKQRRFYPRIFAIIADYPEKAIITGIRSMAEYPCPRCHIPKTQVPNMGMARDKWWRRKKARVDNEDYRNKMRLAHQAIYLNKYAIKSEPVEYLLKGESLTPSQNAFSQRLSHLGFNVFSVVPVDLMHEVEGGVWEAVFLHLLRIVQFVGGHLLDVVDSRYRATPPFGRDAIRKFRRNSSSLGHMATHEWEDLLQCAIPVFDGLVTGPNNARILKLLFVFASWHGFAKLKMHTDETLALLETLTCDLGRLLREFKTKTCPDYATKELAKETQARHRRTKAATKKSQKSSQAGLTGKRTQSAQPGRKTKGSKKALEDPAPAPPDGEVLSFDDVLSHAQKPVTFSLFTYKLHAMGDYVEAIKALGTVDSYSTELAEMQHRKPKAQYSRTSKKDFVKQITRIERREARLRRIRNCLRSPNLDDAKNLDEAGPHYQTINSLRQRYILGQSENESIHLGQFLLQNTGDPAIKDFLPKLKTHIVLRSSKTLAEADGGTNIDLETAVFFQRDRIYTHRVIRFNYTTYDVRREQDLVNPNSGQCNIMLLNRKEGASHPYLYARVLKIFHANAIFRVGDPAPHRFDCLWVRWYKHRQPTSSLELHRVSYPIREDPDSYGFVDPADVIRACHIVPAFAGGRKFTDEHNGTSKLAKDRDDWNEYYISQFADRDLLMRFQFGMGVGHSACGISSPEKCSPSLQDRGTLATTTTPDIHPYDGLGDDGLNGSGEELVQDIYEDRERLEGEDNGPSGGMVQEHDESEASDDDLNDEEFADRHLYYCM